MHTLLTANKNVHERRADTVSDLNRKQKKKTHSEHENKNIHTKRAKVRKK